MHALNALSAVCAEMSAYNQQLLILANQIVSLLFSILMTILSSHLWFLVKGQEITKTEEHLGKALRRNHRTVEISYKNRQKKILGEIH